MDKKSIVLNYISIKPCDEFGVIDNKPCEILYEDKNKWQAICACNSRTDFKFLPIDNNRELEWLFKTSLKGNTLKKCDCCLITQNKIGFIEIKIQHKDTFQDSRNSFLSQ